MVVLRTALDPRLGPLDQPEVVEPRGAVADLGRLQEDEEVDILGAFRRFQTSTDPFFLTVGRSETDPLAREGLAGGIVVSVGE